MSRRDAISLRMALTILKLVMGRDGDVYKRQIWKREMDRRDSIRIKYASKYDESSNYWKNSIGVNRAIRKLHVLEKKRAMERELRRWIQQTPGEREKLLRLSLIHI